MPSIDTIIAVIIAGFALSASPGPSMLYVLSRSVGQSRAAGLASSIGLALGGMILAIGSALGLVIIFEYSNKIYHIIQISGAAYLVYLGYQMITEKEEEALTVNKVKVQSFMKIISQGIIVELLNPKTILFFLAFLPQFIDSSRSDIKLQMIILGMLVPLTAIPSDIIVSIVGGSTTEIFSKRPFLRKSLKWIGGLILIGLALKIILTDFNI